MIEAIKQWLLSVPYGQYLLNRYIISLLILVATVISAKLLLFIFEKILGKLAKKTKTEVDDIIFEKTKRPFFYLIIVYGLKLSLLNLEINGAVIRIVDSLMAIVFIFILARVADVILTVWGNTFAKKTSSSLDDVLLPLVHKVVKVIFFFIAFMWVLDIWQIDITPYLAGVGISGLVLGFALQDSLKNIFGGATLLLDETFTIGDKIKLESGEVGTIHDIGLRSTKLVNFDNEIIYVPNGYLANSRVQNYTRPSPKVRVSVDFGVEYGSDIEKVKKVVLNVVNKMENILNDPKPSALFLQMGDSALLFSVKFWVPKWDKSYDKKLEATQKIYDALNKAKISIPFPTRTVYMKKAK
ncbi:MAG: mechanosensitive ion channel family protein [Nanoarchaeota archaeon]|nr:mechanosensitive ion channel family protein [Nanoarchaeota archaeon]MBU1632368.1 mechanosensitive ion channel family protein [Nanoarchaeota archaeon]MBU1875826.1 mechanosensitive ion channel family protein [Nanoarchaeota archaeon]